MTTPTDADGSDAVQPLVSADVTDPAQRVGGTLVVTVQAAVQGQPGDDVKPALLVSGTVTIRGIPYRVRVHYHWLPFARPEDFGGTPTGNSTHWHLDGGDLVREDSDKFVGWTTPTRRTLDRVISDVLNEVEALHPGWRRASRAARIRDQITADESVAASAALAYERALTRITTLRAELETLTD